MTVKWSHRPPGGTGRFGGGWEWKLGAQCGNLSRRRGHVLISLLVAELSIRWDRR